MELSLLDFKYATCVAVLLVVIQPHHDHMDGNHYIGSPGIRFSDHWTDFAANASELWGIFLA